MHRKPTGNPNGRPPVEIDKKTFEGLCAIQCTGEEIASVFGCCEDTITNWCKREYGMTFSETFKIYSAKGKASLRRYQFKMAEKNPGMAIFLGKNWLGQSDHVEATIREVEDLSPLADMLLKDTEDGDTQKTDD
jgi:hypothetical protein